MDGAMGTELQKAGMPLGGCYELWNLIRPEVVTGIHKAYRAAGALCLTTNTFQANPQALARRGRAEQLEEICDAGIRLARSVAGKDSFVLASVGPMDLSQGTADFDRTLRALASADALFLETWTRGFEIATKRAISQPCNPNSLPVFVSVTYAARTSHEVSMPPNDITPQQVAQTIQELGAVALGVNCGRDLQREELLAVLRGYREVTDMPLLVRPNAGTPTNENDSWVYPISPIEMASWVPDLMAAGAALIGGCCGTTPQHIAAMHHAMD